MTGKEVSLGRPSRHKMISGGNVGTIKEVSLVS